MADRGIIFSAPMVRALLDGRKTQTRRLATSPLRRCKEGDRLYVRESFFVMSDDYGWDDYAVRQGCHPDQTVGYCADQSDGPMVSDQEWEPPINAKREVHGLNGDDDSEAWTLIGGIPSIYMPRWASRLTLIVEAMRTEPLQSISEGDAIAEGTSCYACGGRVDGTSEEECLCFHSKGAAVPSYQALWSGLHGADSWEANPEVLVLTFRIVKANIDARIRLAA